MIIFEDKAFCAERVIYMEIQDIFNSKKEYQNSALSVFFLPDSLPTGGHLKFNFNSHDKAIEKMKELVSIVNNYPL